MAKLTKTFDVAKYKLTLPDGTLLKTFELEELIGEEEVTAAERAGAQPSGMALHAQYIAESIISVNGAAVDVRPYLPAGKWPSRTLDFVRKAFNRFNSATNKELEDFEKAAFGEAAPGRGGSS